MSVKKVETNEYLCDGCNHVQFGELGNGRVVGIIGTATEHHTDYGGNGGEWFACSRECIPDAIIRVLKRG